MKPLILCASALAFRPGACLENETEIPFARIDWWTPATAFAARLRARCSE
jgi:hypothetical protein